MPIKKSRMAGWIVLVFILLGVFVEHGCLSASLVTFRVRRGMTVSQALQVAGDWTWGFAYSERPAPEESVHLPFGHFGIFPGGDHRQPFASLEEVARALNEQMTGHPWRMTLTYLGAMRYSVSFSIDGQGRVQSVSGIWFTQ